MGFKIKGINELLHFFEFLTIFTNLVKIFRMRKSYLTYILTVFVLLAASFQSCNKRVDGIDNNVVIETPYTMYYSDTAGALYNTNDGISIRQMLFPSDGYSSRAICISGNNILWIKHNLYLSANNGTNFNIANYLFAPISGNYLLDVCDSTNNQSVILNAADEGRVYVATFTFKNWYDATNSIAYIKGLGIACSESNGNATTWFIDTVYDGSLNKLNAGVSNTYANVTTLTQLKNNTIVAYDPFHNRIFSKAHLNNEWVEQRHSNTNPDSLPQPNYFTLAHFNNILVAVDNNFGNGAYYSSDTGITWHRYNGLPAGRNLICAASPFDQVLLVGTDSMGVYKLGTDNVTFATANIGLQTASTVHSIAAKVNVYKNDGITKQYVYLATSQGLYRSEDLGQSWIRVQIGNIVTIY